MKRSVILLLLIVSVALLVSCLKDNGKSEMSDNSDSTNENMMTIFGTVCSADEALELSRKTDTVVFERQGCTSGNEVWDSFYQTVMSGFPQLFYVLIITFWTKSI